ncbi:alpha/beta fold hydrolase [Nocardia sp. NBC_01377]|uniref:alpha/beta fold hydrolase n=1 Tax=Nocardia sp. NBC_01377 TaxID=2903595 RepID=UPI0032501ECC
MVVSDTAGAVLVHGLWHGAWCWDAVVAALESRGIDTVAVELPMTELADDIAATRAALDRFARPAVLVGHSYGGAVITEAGAHPLVRELMYIAAYQLDSGESISRTLPDRGLPDSRIGEAMRLDTENGEVSLDPALGPGLLYSDAHTAVAARSAAKLRPVSRLLFRGVPHAISWHRVPSTYVVCTADEVVHPELQRAMAGRATYRVDWDGGHSPALTRPNTVADLIESRIRAL